MTHTESDYSQLIHNYMSIFITRPSHLKIPGGPKMARAALCRWTIDEPCAVNAATKMGHACLLFGG